MNESSNNNSQPLKQERNPFRIATIILSVLLVLGLVGGIAYAVLNSNNKSAETDDSTSLSQTTDIDDNGPTDTTSGPSDTTSGVQDEIPATVAKSGPYIDGDYFVIPDWGVKYKLSDELAGYGWSAWYNGGMEYGLTAALRSEIEAQKPGGYPGPTIRDCSVNIITRGEKTPDSQDRDYGWHSGIGPRKAIIIGDYIYGISTTVGYCQGTDDYLKNVSEIITDILSRPENI
ncbi:MAG: hypothetical protein LBN10_07155 [Propionibacteriaceae bacterium]|jgi:hypothetical protein|nr:hypothetical protein [Propionibacteriaceae bacterium]